MTKNKIADGLKKGRITSGYSVKQVSEFLVNKGFKAGEKTIYSWESGTSQPTPDVFLTLCIHYGISDVLENFGYEELKQNSNTNELLLTDEKIDIEIHQKVNERNFEDEEFLTLYKQLDEGDKGEIRGEMKQMLRKEKYSNKELKRMA